MKFLKKISILILFLPIPIVIAFCSQTTTRNYVIEDLEYSVENEDPDVRLGAVVALAEHGEIGVPGLKKALDDPDPKIKKAAIRALGEVGGEQAAEALSEMLRDPDRNMRVRTIVALGLAGRAALPYLYEALETEPFPRGRMFAANAIGRLARPGDAPEILKRFDRQDSATQMHLVIALVRVGDREAYNALNRLVESPDRLVRFYVANTIAEAMPISARALPVLVNSLDDEAQEVRMWGMFGLERLNHPESYPAVLTALQDEDPYVRKEAAYTLGSLGNTDAVPELLLALRDPHYLVRGNAAEALGMLDAKEALEPLKSLLEEPNPSVKIKSAEALTRLGDYSGMEALIDVLDSPALLYRKEAARALRGISNEDFGRDKQAWLDWWNRAEEAMEGAATRSRSDN